jgi:lysophospholipase L1-like esterase
MRAVAALLAGGLAVLLLLELGVKLWLFGLHPSPKLLLAPSANPTLVYELRPGVEATYTYLNPQVRDREYHVRVNAEGQRGALVDRASGKPRVLVLGDSYAFGFGVNDEETFPHRLEELLGGRADVLNFGVPAYDLAQEVELLRNKGLAYAPDVVVLALHPNDFEPPVFADAEQLRWVLRSHLYAAFLHLRFVALEGRDANPDRDRAARIARGFAAFDQLVAESAARGFDLVVFQASCWSGDDDAEVARLFRDAQQRGIPALEMDRTFCAELEQHSIPDDGHPTAEGHLRLARRLLPLVEPRVDAVLALRGARSGP